MRPNPFKLDLNKFKKMSSDEHATTLQHPDGHEIRIAHKGLSKHMRSKLDEIPAHLAEGGEADDPNALQASQMPQAPSLDQELANLPKATPDQERLQALTDNYYKYGTGQIRGNLDLATQKAQDDVLREKEEQAKIAEAQMQQEQEAKGRQAQADQSYNQRAQRFGLPQREVPGAQMAPAQPQAGQFQNYPLQAARQPGGMPQGGDPYGMQALSETYGSGLKSQLTGIGMEADAAARQGALEQAAAHQDMQRQQQMVSQYQAHYQELQTHMKDLIADYKQGHIDPNAYMNNKSATGKVATAIGLILGGIGGGLTHQENPALKFLNAQIDRDVEAQKAELGKKDKLITAFHHQFGDMTDATNVMQGFYRNMYADQLKEAAAKATDPMAKARALQIAGKLEMEAAPFLGQVAMKKTLLGGTEAGAQIDPAFKIRALVPEKEQPAVMKELQTAQNMSSQKQNLMGAFDKVAQLNSLGSRAMSPIQSSKQIAALREPLLAQLVKDSEGRITPTDTDMIRAFFPAFGDSNETLALKRRNMENFVDQKRHFPLLNAYGIQAGGTSVPKPNPNVMPKR
jgi:hypothetical protein